VSVFADAGAADCDNAPLNPTVCSPASFLNHTIASVGSEVVLSAAVFDWDTLQKIRLGFAVPVAGRELVGARAVSVYVAYGLSF
jgi:hypothetical protein